MGTSERQAVLECAERVLARAGFAVRIESLEGAGCSWLLAENELFALGAIVGKTLDEIEPLEATATQALLDRLGGLNGGAKRWDAYLILLTAQRWSALDDRERVNLVYNTRGIRRLVGAGIVADETHNLEEVVAAALTPFQPLRDPLITGLTDLYEALLSALVVNGVSDESARRYVAAFRARGTLDDV